MNDVLALIITITTPALRHTLIYRHNSLPQYVTANSPHYNNRKRR
ncbi:MAG: hypothetical protein ACI935_002070 [Moritella dasanensis]|jgi:hypothetical protein